jgi:hypothetical protein
MLCTLTVSCPAGQPRCRYEKDMQLCDLVREPGLEPVTCMEGVRSFSPFRSGASSDRNEVFDMCGATQCLIKLEDAQHHCLSGLMHNVGNKCRWLKRALR